MSRLVKSWRVKEWLQEKCENCGRQRVNLSNNGYHLCEKCDWCLELKRRIDDDELDFNECKAVDEN